MFTTLVLILSLVTTLESIETTEEAVTKMQAERRGVAD